VIERSFSSKQSAIRLGQSEHYYERFWSLQLAPAQRRMLDMADLRHGEHIEHLDLADQLFDAALCALGLMYFPTRSRAL
jgi:hypothetical protein